MLITTSRDPSSKLQQFAKVRSFSFLSPSSPSLLPSALPFSPARHVHLYLVLASRISFAETER